MKIFLYHNNRPKFLTIFHKTKQFTIPGQCTDTFISAEDFTKQHFVPFNAISSHVHC